MKNKFPRVMALAGCFTAIVAVFSCGREVLETPPAVPDYNVTEEFDTVANLYKRGWIFNNRSNPIGAATWQQGVYESGKLGPDGFPAYSYHSSGDEYMFAGYQSGGGLAVIDSWMITPGLTLKNGDVVSFYTRTFPGSTYPDRMEARINLTDETADIGPAGSVGKFTTVIAEINPTLAQGGYPEYWAKYSYTVSGLAAPVKRRVAFRYYVSNAGPSGTNSNAIGIDLFKVESR